MKTYFVFITGLLVFLSIKISFSQNISGIINSYSAVSNIAGNVVTVASAASFTAGDRVLIIQMKGASINQSATSSYGSIASYNNTGNFEFGTIASINSNDITLQNNLTNSYDITGLVQMIFVPSFCSPTITDTLTCAAWNGATGGVLAFEVGGTLTMNADIDVSAKGFRGGPTCYGGFGCGFTNYFFNASTCNGGKKGEGIAEYPVGQNGGRGRMANGGGGGNPGNCGGAGGGNYGIGGLGGYEYWFCSNTIQSYGGEALNYGLGKIFMGGAGGTGFADNFQPVFPGTNGGGIVLINANTIITNNHEVRSNSPSVTGITNDESAGGGGSGGTICLSAQTITGNLNVFANGGNGGNTYNYIFSNACHGPGGGGGGGVLWINGAFLPGNVLFTANPGIAGLVQHPTSPCFNTNFGATDGQPGGVIYNFTLPLIPPPGVAVSLGNDTSICENATFTLNAGAGFNSYLWQDGSSNSTYTVSDSGEFIVVVTDSAGCPSSDTILVSLLPPLNISIGNDTTVCPGELVTLVAANGFVSYAWQDGSALQSFSTNSAGTYWVQVEDANGCFGFDTLNVFNFALPVVSLGNDTAMCPDDFVLINAPGFSSYLWQDGSTGFSYQINTPGTYYVHVLDNNGCPGSDTMELTSLYPLPPTDFLPDTLLCPGVEIVIKAPDGFTSYLWFDQSAQTSVEVEQPGDYWLVVTNEYTCENSDSFKIGIHCPTTVFVPNAFTPDGDGLNDVFLTIGYNITLFDLKVFNRWGELLFISNDIDNGWDGKFNSVDCEIGVYVYYLAFEGNEDGTLIREKRKGNVTLLR